MFFQNVFEQDFIGDLILGERGYTIDFKVPLSKNRLGIWASYNAEPYDLSATADRTLTINFSVDPDFRHYASLGVSVGSSSTTSADTIATALNANVTFADRFEAYAENSDVKDISSPKKLTIRAKTRDDITRPMRFYIANSGAEAKLQFNRYAGVNEIPIYFARHTVANRYAYPQGTAQLIALSHLITGISAVSTTVITSANHGLTSGDTVLIVNSNSTPTVNGSRVVTVVDGDTFTVPVTVSTAGTHGHWMSTYEQTIITNAGFTPANLREDWQLLAGRSVLFNFKKNTVDGSSRITQTIEYQAGAAAGDLARKLMYTYTSTNTSPDTYVEIPYVLRSGDLITP